MDRANWHQDEDGEWWYHRPGADRTHRFRGVWATCGNCGAGFPARAHREHTVRYCSRSCVSQHTSGTKPITRPDLFERWTADECWLAGMIWADGTFRQRTGANPDHKGSRVVTLTSTDRDAIAQAAAISGARHHVYPPGPKEKLPKHVIVIGDRRAVTRISDRGLTERKSLTAPWPTPELPHPVDFLRGLFDGDGFWIERNRPSRRLIAGLVGSMATLAGVKSLTNSHGIRSSSITKHESIWALRWHGLAAIELGHLLYDAGGPRMQRKYDYWADRITTAPS